MYPEKIYMFYLNTPRFVRGGVCSGPFSELLGSIDLECYLVIGVDPQSADYRGFNVYGHESRVVQLAVMPPPLHQIVFQKSFDLCHYFGNG